MRRPVLILMLTATLLASACTSEPAAGPVTLELTTTTAIITTTTSTTEAETTTTVDPRIADVEAAVRDFRSVSLSIRQDDSSDESVLEAVATGSMLATALDNLRRGRAEAREWTGEFVGSVVAIDFPSAGVATLLECGLDAVSVSSAAGELIVPPDEQSFLRRYRLEQEANVWKVEAIAFAEGVRTACDL